MSDAMRLDVPIPSGYEQRTARGRASVGVALDAPVVASGDVPRRVGVAGWGARTVFGDLEESWQRLLSGGSIDDHVRLPGLGDRGRAMTLARSVASHVARGRLAAAAGVIVGTSKGSIEDWFSPPPVGLATSDNVAGGLHPSGLGDIAGELAREFQTGGPVLTVSAACASGLHALVRGAMMVRAGEVRQVLVVGVEASVHPLFLGSFQRLGVLAKPGAGCRPFDRARTGFYMAEAACAVLLQASDGTTDAVPLHVESCAVGGDATHLTGGDPDARVLKHLLNKAIDGRPVDLVHAHGTGTEMNDATELAAIEASVCDGGDRNPVVYSHKAALGHSLGASGLLSVVLNCQSHTKGMIPPNVRTTDPLPTGRVVIPQTITRHSVRRSLAIAAGFGGPTAVVSLLSD